MRDLGVDAKVTCSRSTGTLGCRWAAETLGGDGTAVLPVSIES